MKYAFAVLMVLALVAVFAIPVWWTTYKWNDCRAVGHSKFYCVMSVMQ